MPINVPLNAYDTHAHMITDTPAAGTYGVVMSDTTLGLELNGYFLYSGGSWSAVPFSSFQLNIPSLLTPPTQRLVQDKAQESVSVLDFGAVGGPTDDTSAFKAAVAALSGSGGDLIVPYNKNGYSISDGAIVLDSTVAKGVHVIIQGGTVITLIDPSSTATAITISATATSATGPKHRISGGVF